MCSARYCVHFCSKAMLKKSVDPYGALLAYQNTSLECGYSPDPLLMGRQLRTSIPVMPSTLQPRWGESKQLRDRQENIKTRQTVDYDRSHRSQPLNTVCAGNPVRVHDANIGGTVAGTPRSYLLQTPTTCLQRNRRHLVPTPNHTCNYNINILVGLGQRFIQLRWSGNPKLARNIPLI